MTKALTFDPATGRILSRVDDAEAGAALPPAGPGVILGVSDADYASASDPGVVWNRDANGGKGAVNVAPLLTPPPPPLLQLYALAQQKIAAGVWFKPAGASQPALFATSGDAQTNLTAASALADKGRWRDGFPYPTLGGPRIPLASADVTALAELVGDYVLDCNAHAMQLGAEMAAGQSPDLTAGWPSQGTPPAPPSTAQPAPAAQPASAPASGGGTPPASNSGTGTGTGAAPPPAASASP